MSIPSLIKGIVLNSDIESGEYFKFKPVSDMDNLKYLASQLIYINYLQNTENKTITNTLLSSYKENVVQRYRQLKPRVSLDLNYITDIFDRILHSFDNSGLSQCHSVNLIYLTVAHKNSMQDGTS